MKLRPATRLLIFLLALYLTGCASLPAGTLEGGAPSSDVPARFYDGHVLVPVRIAEAEPVWLLLDTGADMTILDLRAARELGVPMSGTSEVRGIGAETAVGGITAEPISIQVVGSNPYRLRRAVVDLSTLEPFLGTALQGILGGDAFVRFVVEIDYAGERVTLHDSRRFQPHSDDVRLALEVDRQLPHVRASLVLPDGREIDGRFLIDTGMDASLVLYTPFVRSHGLLEAVSRTIPMAAAGVGGQVAGRQGRLKAFRIGPYILDEPIARFSQAEAGLTVGDGMAGVIGSGVLRRFTVTFDYRRGALYLRPNARFAEPFEADMAGLMIRAEGTDFREYRVHRVPESSPAERAGLREGDLIVEVTGRPAAEFSLPELRELTRTEPGQVLQLLVRRGSETLSIPLRLNRRI